MSLLSLAGIRKRCGEPGHEIEVLGNLDLEVCAGEFVGVWGSRGSGKTTLLRIAAGLETPTAGTVKFDGRDLATLTLEERVGLWQHGIGWAGGAGPTDEMTTALAYVTEAVLGCWGREQVCEEAVAVLERVGMSDAADERWEDLGDLEQLRTNQREYLMDLLRALAEDALLGVLITTSEMGALLHVNRIGWLSDGRILEPSENHRGGDA